jgi:hypothetical protein
MSRSSRHLGVASCSPIGASMHVSGQSTYQHVHSRLLTSIVHMPLILIAGFVVVISIVKGDLHSCRGKPMPANGGS